MVTPSSGSSDVSRAPSRSLSRRSSVTSLTSGQDSLDPSWRVWKLSRRRWYCRLDTGLWCDLCWHLIIRESRRSSVLSVSGEDHGVASVAGGTRTRGAEEETPSMVTGKQFVQGGNTRSGARACHEFIVTHQSWFMTLSIRSETMRLRMLEDHVTKHSLRSEPHTMCRVCTRILEGKWQVKNTTSRAPVGTKESFTRIYF